MSDKLESDEFSQFSATYPSDILRDIEHRLRISLDTLLEGCQIIGYDWKYLYLNETAARHGMRKREELLGRSILEMYPGIEETEVFAEMKVTMEKRTSRRMKNLFTFPDGSQGWFELSIQPIPEGIFILSIDITEDRGREEALRESEERFRLISENVGDLIALLDPDGERIYASPSYANLLGEPDLLRGTDAFREVHPDDQDRVRKQFLETVSTGIGSRTEYRLRLTEGRVRHIESNCNVVRDHQGRVNRVVVVSRDVTERKMMEEQYLRTRRLETIGTLAGGIAHDLNNVLTPILVSIYMLRRNVRPAQAGSMLDTLEASAKRGAELVNQILSFARGGETSLANISIDLVVAEIRRLVSVSFPKSITLVTEVPNDLWPVSAVATQVHQVIMNLVVNARDAMPRGGTLTLTAANAIVEGRSAAMHPGVPEGQYVTLSVSDTGTGIPASILEKIFEPFYTTKEIGKGTGLGLSTTSSIVKSHGGFLTVESEIGRGSTFTVYLPKVTSEAAVEQAGSGEETTHGRGEVVLLVETEAALREITRSTLDAYGYSVLTAADGAEAVSIFADDRNSIDLVITEIVMPFMDGHATIRELQKLNPRVRVLGVGAIINGEYRMKYPDTERVRFLQKPYSAERLLSMLRAMLDAPA